LIKVLFSTQTLIFLLYCSDRKNHWSWSWVWEAVGRSTCETCNGWTVKGWQRWCIWYSHSFRFNLWPLFQRYM